MDERMMYDGRRLPPRNSRGEFRRRRSGDRGMDYGYDMRMGDGRVIRSYPTIHPQGDYGDMNYDMARGGRRGQGGGRGRDRGDYGDYRGEDMRRGDMRGDYAMDGHHMGGGRQSNFEPVEFMGHCTGYYGSTDYGDYRGGRDYGYDMRGGYGRRDYGDYGYDYGYPYGDFGEVLSEKELESWNKRLMEQLDEREKQMFSKEAVIQRAKSMGIKMEGFGEKELYTTVLMVISDYKKSIGDNLDLSIKIAVDWLQDQDAAYRGAEKLAMYKDYIVDGGEE